MFKKTKKEMAIFFNSPYLGGAERSLIYQCETLSKNFELTFFIPYLIKAEETQQIQELLQESGFDRENFVFLSYPQSLFSVSRSGRFRNLFVLIFSFLSLFNNFSLYALNRYDYWWANGNKIGLALYLWALLGRFKNKFVWHFRDYPATTGVFSNIWHIYKLPKPFKFSLIGNSFSVSSELEKIKGKRDRVYTLYNPIGAPLEFTKRKSIKNIGIVAMFAPWKGLHFIVSFLSIYENKLLDLGIENVFFFGKEIYRTDGGHSGYTIQLRDLKKSLHGKWPMFCGSLSPESLYPQLDLLIHSSLRPEPFGRVLIEAFASGIPVISTGLGGAGELLGGREERGDKFFPYDYEGLFITIKNRIEFPQEKIDEAKGFINQLDNLTTQQFDQILNN
jgi:glycosyltransferase involved in cell wall biosynthesis